MKCLLCLAIYLLLALPASVAWSQRSSYDPAAKQQSKPREGFVDFALKQINPQNTDYGCQLDAARKLAVDQTIKSIDSWAVLVALIFLVLSFFMLWHQHRERNRREVIAAEFLAQYHNAWVDARRQAEEAIRRYNEVVHTTNSAGEAALRSPSPDAEHAQTNTAKPDVRRDVKPQSAPVATARSDIKAGENGAGQKYSGQGIKAPVRQNREPEVDLVAEIRTLQQQLNASHEREKNLQKELSKAQRQAPAEQSPNTNLPG